MATADELLKKLAIQSDPEGHIVVGYDRFITVPSNLKRLGVQYDHNMETVTFDCPRYWDNRDMSTMKVYINYMLSNGYKDRYIADNVTADDEVMHFEWTISSNVTQVAGAVSFLVCVMKTDAEGNEERHWNSELCQECYISKGMETEESSIDMYPDLVTQLLLRMDSVEQINVQADEMQALYDATVEVANAAEEAKNEVLDTSVYIKNSHITLIDKLCPPFEETGTIVTCAPVEGYPLTVAPEVVELPPPDYSGIIATQITRCGKNLFDTKGEVKEVWYKNNEGAIQVKNGFEICLPPGTYTVHAEKATTGTTDRWIYGIVIDRTYNVIANCNIVIGQNLYNRTITIGDRDKLLLYNGTTGGTLESAQNLLTKYFDIQIEQGSVATAYESYAGGSFAVGEEIPALPGINYLYADAGSITVSGRADLTAMIEKLTNAIIALGGIV